MACESSSDHDKATSETVLINCDGVMGMREVSSMQQQLQDALKQAKNIEIDVSEVERVDTAVLQLIYVFKQSAQAKGLTVTWKAVSETFKLAAQTLGLGTYLELPTQ